MTTADSDNTVRSMPYKPRGHATEYLEGHVDEIEKALRENAEKVDRLEEHVYKQLTSVEENTTKCADNVRLLRERLYGTRAEETVKPGSRLSGRRPRRRRDDDAEGALRTLAKQGVQKVVIDRDHDGAATIKIGFYPRMKLSPTLTDLLELLCLDIGASCDQIVAYKSVSQLVPECKKKLSNRHARHAVMQNLSRLRKALSASGNNPYLIQRNKDGLYRLALQRNGELQIK